MSLVDRVVLHVSGPDKPGVTHTLCRAIEESGAHLIDLGQSVLHGYLSLSAIVDIPEKAPAIHKALMALSRLGMRLDVASLENENRDNRSPQLPLCLTLLGHLSEANRMSRITHFLAEKNLNIIEIKTLSRGQLEGVELIVSPYQRTQVDLIDLREVLLNFSNELGIDISLQNDDIFRRNKRLVCFDVDSTFIKIEVIDELAGLMGVKSKVAAITERAMKGEYDFSKALEERVALLKGLEVQKAKEFLLKNSPLSEGAEKLLRTVKGLGFKVGLVSGGFDFFVNELKARYGFDFAIANTLEVKDGQFTGKVLGAIVDAQRKAQVLKDMAQAFDIRIEQTIAVGDGANDREMLKNAGLGIAFKAKASLQKVADSSLNVSSMDSLLYLLGYPNL